MTLQSETQDVIKRLAQLLSAGQLAREPRKAAETLVARLSSPVRITLAGTPAVGKSALRDFLVDAIIVPIGLELPTTQLQFGDQKKIVATLGDRSVKTIDGLDFLALQNYSPALVEVQAPLNRLKEFSLLEVVTDGSPNELGAALKWAATRTDITIWVTTEFGPDEQAIWAQVPDEIKDHGYLVLNQIDLLSPQEREDRKVRLQAIAAQTFRSFFAISAISTPAAGQTGNRAKESGCDRLLKALTRHVEMAGQADLDRALLFLSRFEPAVNPDTRPTPTTVEHNAQVAENGKNVPDPVPAASALRIEEIATDGNRKGAPASREAHETVIARLRDSAASMLAEASNPPASLSEIILDRCKETVEELTVALPEDDQLFEPVQQVGDLIVLLQLEKSDAAAENAVAALLQLKHEFEVALAA